MSYNCLSTPLNSCKIQFTVSWRDSQYNRKGFSPYVWSSRSGSVGWNWSLHRQVYARGIYGITTIFPVKYTPTLSGEKKNTLAQGKSNHQNASTWASRSIFTSILSSNILLVLECISCRCTQKASKSRTWATQSIYIYISIFLRGKNGWRKHACLFQDTCS
jgi:hypothetical protein